jgi:hypothetical protein
MSKRIKWTHKMVGEYVLNNSDCKLLSDTYKDMNIKLKFECKCGNPFIASFDKFLYRNKRRCNICSGRKKIDTPINENKIKREIVTIHNNGEELKAILCTECNEIKPLEEFSKLENGTAGVRSKCKNCINNKRKIKYRADRRDGEAILDGKSYPEKIMAKVLSQLNINYEWEKTFDWSRNIESINKNRNGTKRYDFYIPSFNMIIEVHGRQHYDKSFFKGRSLKQEKENDLLKEKLAIQNGIKDYIVINCSISDLEFIKANILKSKLSTFFSLEEINWLECHEFACKSLAYASCELWNQGTKCLIKIGQKLNIHSDTVRDYLKQGEVLGWCDYKAIHRIEVVQLSESGEYLKEWESLNDASREMGINVGSLSYHCSRKGNIVNGYVYLYKNDYDNKSYNIIKKDTEKENNVIVYLNSTYSKDELERSRDRALKQMKDKKTNLYYYLQFNEIDKLYTTT